MNRKSDRHILSGRRHVSLHVLALLVFALAGFATAEDKAPPIVNAQAAKLKNPLASEATTIDAGRELYLTHCASCHGVSLAGGESAPVGRQRWTEGNRAGSVRRLRFCC